VAKIRKGIAAERRAQIVAGALRVFSTKGFAQATNREIAEAAGLGSPGLIYHYFVDKADLLRAVVETYAPPVQLLQQMDNLMTLPPREMLTKIALAYVGLMDQESIGSVIRLLIGEAQRDAAFARVLGEIGPFRIWRFLAAYLERQMLLGTLRQADPTDAADCFLGPLMFRLLKRLVLRWEDTGANDPQAFAAWNVEHFLSAMATDPKA